MKLGNLKGGLVSSWKKLDDNVHAFVAELLNPKECGLIAVPMEQQGWHPDNWDKQDTHWNWGMVNVGSPKAGM